MNPKDLIKNIGDAFFPHFIEKYRYLTAEILLVSYGVLKKEEIQD
jgi:hypothetical protein